MENPIPDELKTKNLMLLMGTNPLPNYVAARLLSEKDTRFHLLVTPEIEQADIHRRLVTLLGGNPYDEKQYVSVESADPSNIFAKVQARVSKIPGSWGLNYTGGKKSMATHAYRAMEAALGSTQQGVYSYLDADTLLLVVDPRDTKPSQFFSTVLPEPVSLKQLLYLHGKPDSTVNKVQWETYRQGFFESQPLGKKPHRIPFRPSLCESLKNAWLSDSTREKMHEWFTRELSFGAHRFFLEIFEKSVSSIDEASELARQAVMLTKSYDPANKFSKNHVNKRKNPEYKLSRWQAVRFPPFLEKQIGLATVSELAEQTVQKVSHIAEWLQGQWLEHYVLHQILTVKDECDVNDYALGLESNIFEPVNLGNDVFESDVIVMQGHRLFYISVTMDSTKYLCKTKLFEAFIRAQHLGGEQAEAALVSFYNDSARLEKEVRDERHVRVKVFGPEHLSNSDNFQTELQKWFKQPRKE